MIIQKEELTPIFMFGALCLLMAFVGVIFFFRVEDQGFKVFCTVITTFNLLVALGISFRTMWGFKLLKGYLHYLKFGYPFFTFMSRYLLRHIEENDIQRYFGKGSLEL